MKINISRITEIREAYKPIEDIIFKVYEEREDYINYELIRKKSLERKLIFENVNHKRMLHKYMIVEHIYIILILTFSISLYQIFKDNALFAALIFVGGLILIWVLASKCEVPHKLVFDGLIIYEMNHMGKRIIEFNPNYIMSCDIDKYENDFIFISSSKISTWPNKNMKSLIVMVDFEFEIKDFLRRYFNGFEFTSSIKIRG